MNGNTSSDSTVRAGIRKRIAQVVVLLLFLGAMLFLGAGSLTWFWGWVYLGLYLAGILVNGIVLARTHPETVARRSESEGMKDWDKVVGGLWAVAYFVAIPLVSGLDTRFGWTVGARWPVHLTGAVGFALGFGLFSWAMVENAYFSTVVRVQEAQGQQVCTSGPYRVVRHPGYLGAVLQSLSSPLVLGSAWALLPGAIAAALMVVRALLEDRTLHAELSGYAAYAEDVRYRLIPGIW
jgi:protein-S-isoprenylcysteine O-methyltransferase Ste14